MLLIPLSPNKKQSRRNKYVSLLSSQVKGLDRLCMDVCLNQLIDSVKLYYVCFRADLVQSLSCKHILIAMQCCKHITSYSYNSTA